MDKESPTGLTLGWSMLVTDGWLYGNVHQAYSDTVERTPDGPTKAAAAADSPCCTIDRSSEETVGTLPVRSMSKADFVGTPPEHKRGCMT